MPARDARLQIRCSRAERHAIEQWAKKAGLTVSEFVRTRCTADPQGPTIVADAESLRELYIGLRKIGGNLNQIAHVLNAYHNPNDVEDALRAALAAVAQASDDVSRFIADARRNV